VKKETQKVFDAPFAVMGDAEDYTKFNVIISSPNSPRHCCTLASCVDRKTAIRFARLPELYDALEDAANRLCGEPMYRGQYACKSCVVKDSCQVRKWYELLEKVRDGK